jgi:hypothetical protein
VREHVVRTGAWIDVVQCAGAAARTLRLPVHHSCRNRQTGKPSDRGVTQRSALFAMLFSISSVPYFAIWCQCAPLVERVVDRLGGTGLRRQRFELCPEPGFVDFRQEPGWLCQVDAEAVVERNCDEDEIALSRPSISCCRH